MAEITLKEYAGRHGKAPVSVRQLAQRGGFRTAHKIGRDWVVDEHEPYPDDRRVKPSEVINREAMGGLADGAELHRPGRAGTTPVEMGGQHPHVRTTVGKAHAVAH